MVTIIAHRGASKEAPENTLIAMQKALEIGVDYIEFDVHLSKDGVPIVIHDAILGRTTDRRALERITDLELSEIKELDVGQWFGINFQKQHVPTLEEVLKLERGATGFMLEIKKGHSQIKPLVTKILDVVEQSRKDNLIIGSFSIQIMEELRRLAPTQPLIGIVEDFNMLQSMRAMRFSHLAIWYKLLNPQLVKEIHEEGTKIWTFTVDDPRTVEFLNFIEVDGITTNDPRLLRKLFK